MSEGNAITERIGRLRDQWTEFADDDEARLLHWVIDSDEWGVLDAFFTVESLEQSSSEDAFVVVDAPFEGATGHGLRLRAWLTKRYEEIRPELEEAGVRTDWSPPPVGENTDDVAALHQAAESMWEHHQPLFRHLVLALVPTKISDSAQWVSWVERLVAAAEFPNVRFIAVDHQANAQLGPIAAKHPARMSTVTADLDMPGAYVELSAEAGQLDEPAGKFRHAFVKMSNAFGEGDTAAAEREATVAKSVAQSQGWTHLVFAVDFARGSGFLGTNDIRTSMSAYRDAEKTAETAEANDEDYGVHLRLKARLGQGAACVAIQGYEQGAQTYESCVPLAEEVGDKRTLLDCHRMAAYCHEQAGHVDPAWNKGMDAVGVGKTMDEEERKTSTLAYAGEGLLRLCKNGKFRGYDRGVDQQMRELLGDEWRTMAQPQHPPAA